MSTVMCWLFLLFIWPCLLISCYNSDGSLDPKMPDVPEGRSCLNNRKKYNETDKTVFCEKYNRLQGDS